MLVFAGWMFLFTRFVVVFVLCSSKAEARQHAAQLLLQAGALTEEASRLLSQAGVPHEHVALECRAVLLTLTKLANQLSQIQDAKVRRALFALLLALGFVQFSICLLQPGGSADGKTSTARSSPSATLSYRVRLR
jgi:hypothetical protein